MGETTATGARGRAGTARLFGDAWESVFHHTHELCLRAPVLHCARCGSLAQSLQHSAGLKAPCKGAPQKGTARADRLNKLKRDNQHPVTGAALETPLPVPRA